MSCPDVDTVVPVLASVVFLLAAMLVGLSYFLVRTMERRP